MSQCLWEDVPSQITAILSPSYDNSSTSIPSPSTASGISSTHVDTGVIAGAVVAGVVVLAAASILAYYLRRRRSQRVSTTAIEDIALARFNEQGEDKKSFRGASGFPFDAVSKPDLAPSIHSQYRPNGELGTQGEIYQLPAHDNREGNYFTEAMQMASERRAGGMPEIANTGVMYELAGSDPAPVELDDARSREGLLPPAPRSRGRSSRLSSRASSPPSEYLST